MRLPTPNLASIWAMFEPSPPKPHMQTQALSSLLLTSPFRDKIMLKLTAKFVIFCLGIMFLFVMVTELTKIHCLQRGSTAKTSVLNPFLSK